MKKREMITFFAILILDQITKGWIQMNMKVYESIDVIKGFFRITYVQNTGAAWSVLEGQMWFFYVITAVALVGMVYYLRQTKKEQWWLRLAIVLLIAGTLGNFLDRVMLQYVRDFLDFVIFGYDFPVFNVADISLCIGVGMLVIETFITKEGKHGSLDH